jgi:hypothetical protein
LALVEHHRQDVERKLRIVLRKVLRFGREKPELELATTLHRFQVEPLVLVTLMLGRRESFLALIEPMNDFCNVDHDEFS